MNQEIKTDTLAPLWMPLYIPDYLADTSHLSTEEHGAYFLLIMHAWMNGGALPIDDQRLRRIARMDEKPWKASRDEIKHFFYEQDGFLRHARVDKELERAKALVNQRIEAGKSSAKKRTMQREAQRKGNENPTTVATTVEATVSTNSSTESQRKGNQSQSQLQIKPVLDTSSQDSHSVCATMTEAGALSVELIKRGVKVTSMHPTLQSWVTDGYTLPMCLEAVAIARQHKPPPETIPAKYLDRILRDSGQMNNQTTSAKGNIHDQRAATIAELTGQNRSQQHSEHVIDCVASRVD